MNIKNDKQMKHFIILILAVAFSQVNGNAQDTLCHKSIKQDTLYEYICNCGCHNHPVNNYSGLNSLKARIAMKKALDDSLSNGTNRTWSISVSGKVGGKSSSITEQDSTIVSHTEGDLNMSDSMQPTANIRLQLDSVSCYYLKSIASKETPVGVPVYFFFELATSALTDDSQLINLDAIADIATKHHLVIRITGAADSATGTSGINATLSKKRADYIAEELRKRGVPDDCLKVIASGGINSYTPVKANRNCKVELFVK